MRKSGDKREREREAQNKPIIILQQYQIKKKMSEFGLCKRTGHLDKQISTTIQSKNR